MHLISREPSSGLSDPLSYREAIFMGPLVVSVSQTQTSSGPNLPAHRGKAAHFALMPAPFFPFSSASMKSPLLTVLPFLTASATLALGADFKRDIVPIL